MFVPAEPSSGLCEPPLQDASNSVNASSSALSQEIQAGLLNGIPVRTLVENLERALIAERSKRRSLLDKTREEEAQKALAKSVQDAWQAGLRSGAAAIEKRDKLLARAAVKLILVASGEFQTNLPECARDEAPRVLRDALNVFPRDRVVQREALRAIVSLSCPDHTRHQLASLGCISLATDALQSTAVNDDHLTVEAALGVISNLGYELAADSETKEESKQPKGSCTIPPEEHARVIDSISAVMIKYARKIKVQERGLHALANVVEGSTESSWNKESFGQCVLGAMRSFEMQDIQRFGLMALVNGLSACQADGGKFRSHMIQQGCALTVKQAVWNFDTDEVIAAWSKRAYGLL